jgi:hypothetical protein
MHVDGIGVVEGADLLEDVLGYVALEVRPAFGRHVQDVVQLDAVLFSLQLLPHHDVVLCLVGEQQHQLDSLALHVRDFHHGLVDWRDAAAPSDHEQPFRSVLLSLCIDNGLLTTTVPPAL